MHPLYAMQQVTEHTAKIYLAVLKGDQLCVDDCIRIQNTLQGTLDSCNILGMGGKENTQGMEEHTGGWRKYRGVEEIQGNGENTGGWR